MDCLDSRIDIFLQPGEFYFGDRYTRIRTLLGSCVSFTAWHPRRRIGGMSHYLLPTRTTGRTGELDGRYGDEAVLWFLREAAASGSPPQEFELKIFGGGDMFEVNAPGRLSVGRRNIMLGLELLEEAGYRIVARHLGGSGHRTVIFDVGTGDVWVRHVPLPTTRAKALAA